jgi:hypothetical protein
MRAKSVLALVPALALLAGCEFDDVGGFGRYHEDFHYAYPLKTGGRLAVESFNGSIEVSPWDQDNIDISGTKFARTPEEAADIRIDIDHTSDAVSIRARRPLSRYGNQGARFWSGLSPRMARFAPVTEWDLHASNHPTGAFTW